MSTWAEGVEELQRFEFCFNTPKCQRTADSFPAKVFSSELQKTHVDELLALHARQGDEHVVSQGFSAIAAQRRRWHPLRLRVGLPLVRVLKLWTTPADEIIRKPERRPWKAFFEPLFPCLGRVTTAFALAFACGLAVLLAFRNTRVYGAILGSALVFRTLALAYFYYPEPRYLFEVLPAATVVIVLGWAELVARLHALAACAWRRARTPAATR